jgi:peptidyl-prolyl cis-trans isomerase SurA
MRRHWQALAVLAAGLLAASPARAETANRIIAVINDDIITEAELAEHVEAMLAERDAPEGATPAQVMQEMLRRLIQQRLILQEAKREGVVVGGDEIAKRLDEMAQRAGSPETFESLLEEQGLTRDQLKEQIRDQMMIERVIASKVKSTIMVSPQEVAQEIEAHPELAKTGDRIRASHLLVRVDERRSEEDAKALAERLRQELADGADFDALAKQHSEDSHARQGGDMGWVAQGELMPELDAVLFGLEPGAVSPPVKSRLGFHLLRAGERRPASSLTVMEAHAEVYQMLFQRKYQDVLSRWLKGLADRAFVQVLAPQQDS